MYIIYIRVMKLNIEKRSYEERYTQFLYVQLLTFRCKRKESNKQQKCIASCMEVRALRSGGIVQMKTDMERTVRDRHDTLFVTTQRYDVPEQLNGRIRAGGAKRLLAPMWPFR